MRMSAGGAQYDLVSEEATESSRAFYTESDFQRGICFQAQLIGKMDVARPRDRGEIISAMRRIRYEFKVKCIKKRRVVISVSVDGITVFLKYRKKKLQFWKQVQLLLFQHEVHKVFYVSHDSQDLKIFSYIARDSTTNMFICVVFKAFKKSDAVTIVSTIGQAFEVCHRIATNQQQQQNAPNSPDTANNKNNQKLPLTGKNLTDTDGSTPAGGSEGAADSSTLSINQGSWTGNSLPLLNTGGGLESEDQFPSSNTSAALLNLGTLHRHCQMGTTSSAALTAAASIATDYQATSLATESCGHSATTEAYLAGSESQGGGYEAPTYANPNNRSNPRPLPGAGSKQQPITSSGVMVSNNKMFGLHSTTTTSASGASPSRQCLMPRAQSHPESATIPTEAEMDLDWDSLRPSATMNAVTAGQLPPSSPRRAAQNGRPTGTTPTSPPGIASMANSQADSDALDLCFRHAKRLDKQNEQIEVALAQIQLLKTHLLEAQEGRLLLEQRIAAMHKQNQDLVHLLQVLTLRLQNVETYLGGPDVFTGTKEDTSSGPRHILINPAATSGLKCVPSSRDKEPVSSGNNSGPSRDDGVESPDSGTKEMSSDSIAQLLLQQASASSSPLHQQLQDSLCPYHLGNTPLESLMRLRLPPPLSSESHQCCCLSPSNSSATGDSSFPTPSRQKPTPPPRLMLPPAAMYLHTLKNRFPPEPSSTEPALTNKSLNNNNNSTDTEETRRMVKSSPEMRAYPAHDWGIKKVNLEKNLNEAPTEEDETYSRDAFENDMILFCSVATTAEEDSLSGMMTSSTASRVTMIPSGQGTRLSPQLQLG